MNNLKFRVWSKKDDTLYYPEKFSGVFVININGDILGFDAETKSFEYLNEKDYVIQQFTGLKDKNGKEIYLGDILNFIDFSGNFWFRAEIRFSKGSFVCWNEDFEVDPIFGGYAVRYEIIGNIHENPALLTKRKVS